ncbi:MAG: GTP 3',8-cyclase MoaA [Pseudonocardiales bacterium]|nr:MAG: GTP 3',8-cyclase MoaA [Pseudonocardiales bacterium]
MSLRPGTVARVNRLVDRHGRAHRDLRVSLTDRCSLRCTYCMPAEGLPWLPAPDLLTTPELIHLVRLTTTLGIDEVRLTGGEPLLRPDVVSIVAALADAVELSVTTNGLVLDRLAPALRDAGLTRVNISIDTLRRDRFKEMTRRDRLDDVFAGITAATRAGLHPVKLNTVLMRGVNDDEAVDLLRFALDAGVHLRFIEQMPLDAQHGWRRTEMVTADEILSALSDAFTLTPVAGRGSAPAERWYVDGGPETVGVIGSVTRPFCGNCDRLRLTADGQLRTCLFARTETDLRGPLRAGASDRELADLIVTAVLGKQPGHGINDPTFLQPPRSMSAIGG